MINKWDFSSVVECLLDMQEVGCSIQPSPTIKKFFVISARIRTWWNYRYGRNFTRNIINDDVVINFLKIYTMAPVKKRS